MVKIEQVRRNSNKATGAHRPVPPYSIVNARPKAITNTVVEVEITTRKGSGSVMKGNGAWIDLFLLVAKRTIQKSKGPSAIEVNGKGASTN
jgi:hypothetical protein